MNDHIKNGIYSARTRGSYEPRNGCVATSDGDGHGQLAKSISLRPYFNDLQASLRIRRGMKRILYVRAPTQPTRLNQARSIRWRFHALHNEGKLSPTRMHVFMT